MTIREEKIERYEEALFTLWADEVAVREGRDLERENAALRLDANFRVPEEVVRRGRELISRKLAARTARSVGHHAWRLVHAAALVCLFSMLAFSAAFAASPTFRANTLNLVIETFDEGTRFHFSTSEYIELSIPWVPEGFTLADSGSSNYIDWFDYQSAAGEYINISKTKSWNTTFTLDTENSIVQDMTINGYPTIIASKDNDVQILIADTGKQFFVQIEASGVSVETLIQVIEKMKF